MIGRRRLALRSWCTRGVRVTPVGRDPGARWGGRRRGGADRRLRGDRGDGADRHGLRPEIPCGEGPRAAPAGEAGAGQRGPGRRGPECGPGPGQAGLVFAPGTARRGSWSTLAPRSRIWRRASGSRARGTPFTRSGSRSPGTWSRRFRSRYPWTRPRSPPWALSLVRVRQVEIRVGEVVAVIGLGVLGLLTVQLVHAAGGPWPSTSTVGKWAWRREPARGRGSPLRGRGRSGPSRNGRAWSRRRDHRGRHLQRRSHPPGRGHCPGAGAGGGGGRRSHERALVLAYEKELELRLSRSHGPGRYDA